MKDTLRNIVKDALGDGQVLIDLSENQKGDFFKVIIDSENGIKLIDTAKLTKILRKSQRMENLFPNGYRLEVSTPGVEESLIYPFQYKKNINRQITIVYIEKDEHLTFFGKIISADENTVELKSDDFKLSLGFDQIVSANVNLSFK
tara:strand:- start:174 stop:611 length:438 start_codon:yes stop_codon:yes gene_type:complete